MSNIIMGEKVQLWVSGECLAMATSLSVEVNADTVDISSKDNGRFSASKLGKISWTASSDALFTIGDYNKLIDAMVKNTAVDLIFSSVGNYDEVINNDPDEDGLVVDNSKTKWTKKEDMWYGKAYITSISLNANNGEVATYSVSFNGTGPLKMSENNPDKAKAPQG